jgi:hypothetical protein
MVGVTSPENGPKSSWSAKADHPRLTVLVERKGVDCRPSPITTMKGQYLIAAYVGADRHCQQWLV